MKLRFSTPPSGLSNGDKCNVYFSFIRLTYYTWRVFNVYLRVGLITPRTMNKPYIMRLSDTHTHISCHSYLYNRWCISRDGFFLGGAVLTIRHKQFWNSNGLYSRCETILWTYATDRYGSVVSRLKFVLN